MAIADAALSVKQSLCTLRQSVERTPKPAPFAILLSLRVYHAGVNPSVDPFSFRQSNLRAAAIVESGQGRYIVLDDGRQAVQLYRAHSEREFWVAPPEQPAGAAPPLNLIFIPPLDWQNTHPSAAGIRDGWDWTGINPAF